MLEIGASLATFGACLAILSLLALLLIRRTDLPFGRMVGLACAIVVACGTVHLLDGVRFWWPVFELPGGAKAVTAIISWVAVAAMISAVPRALALRSSEVPEVQTGRRSEANELPCRLANAVESFEDPVIRMTIDGVITSWNKGAERMFQYAPNEVIGQDVSMLVPRDGGDATRRWLRNLGAEQRIEPFETVLCGKDGACIDALLVLSAVRDGGRQTVGASMIVRDIAQRKHAEGVLKQKEERLRESQKLEAVGALAGGVAHEFNNLLQAIHGYTKYAMEGLSTQEQRYQDLQQVLDASDRAALLVRQLLNFGRRQAIERTEIDFNELLANMETMLRPLIGEQIDLRIDLCPSKLVVEGDAGLLQQSVLNLCINARDAMVEGGRLCVRSEKVVLNEAYCRAHVGVEPGRYAALTVADTGQGISKEVSGHIFEPFFTTKEVGKGTGLGLAMVYGVVRQHGGVIHVYSEPEQGATFKIYFPLVGAQEPSEPASDAAQRSGMETVLVAEDETMVRELLARVLEEAGYTVLSASDGEEAQRVFRANAEVISLALLDVVMPTLSGRAVYEGIKRLKPETKVVFCTGYDPETGQADFATEEGLRLLQKPVDPEQLLRTIREVLDDEEPCQILQSTT